MTFIRGSNNNKCTKEQKCINNFYKKGESISISASTNLNR